MLLLSLGLVLLQSLDLILELSGLLDQICLIVIVFLSILMDGDAGLSNVNLQFFSLFLAVMEQLLMVDHILLHVFNDLHG